ncbi:hypothetical protein [Mucilaginibacter sp. OK098]|uniref:hypothetical protein n=1 Tax=Mucilaginibacter sp. OK098 TaxID=1855297 RepID=UPI000915D310|nr:hypothetical protein [Mucilaginibacter sp. OK098]SHM50406.1 hypothetical protein SAMN05216524_102321 [Mucilaginibacter sp. OK098]
MTTLTAEPVYWSTAQKIAFRFFMIFFLLYMFFNPNGVFPYSDSVQAIYLQPFYKLVPFIGAHILHLHKPIIIAITGSGDTTYDYIIILLIFLMSIIGTIVWSITGRSTSNYNKLFYWLTVMVRYYVAITMISYGLYKVIKLQFPSPSFSRLLEPVGNLSPMGLAWTYMGYSKAFNYFTGFAEVLTGLLLFSRKTSTLGAIVGFVVAANIMAINYCFDVPVKLLATTLVIMCFFLMLRDAGRLINFFFKNKEALPSNLTPHRFKVKWKNTTLVVIKYVLIIYTLCFGLVDAFAREKQNGAKAKKPPLYGIYNVEAFIKNRDTLKPLLTDTIRWRRFMISRGGSAQIQMMNDSIRRYNFKTDIKKRSVIAYTDADTTHKFNLIYNLTKPGLADLKNFKGINKNDTTEYLVLKGVWKKDTIEVWMRRLDPNGFPLLQRGFHWVNESAYNK